VTRDDVPAFATLLDTLAEALDAPVSELRKLAYFDALSDLEFPAVATAVRGLMRTARFFPKPVDIREAVLGDVESIIESEWLALHTAMATVGAYRSLICQNATLGQTIVALFGSWPDACRADFTAEMWTAKRKEFGRVYRLYAGDLRLPTNPTVLKGLSQIANEHQDDWSRFIGYGLLSGRTARLLTPAEAQEHVGTTRLLEAPEPSGELSPSDSALALKDAFDRVMKDKGMA